MKNPPDPMADLARRLRDIEAEGDDADGPEPVDDPEAAEYVAALAALRAASADFERATSGFAQARDQLGRLTPPWVAASVAVIVWALALSAAWFAAPGGIGPLARALALAACAVWSGETAGRGLRRAMRGATAGRMAAGAGQALFGAGLAAAALFGADALESWFTPALVLLAVAGAATTPWIEGGGEHYARLSARAENALDRQIAAFNTASRAADRLQALHEARMARHWGRPGRART